MGVPPPPRPWGHAYCRWLCRGHRGRRVPLIRRLRMGSLLPGCWGAEPRGWLLVHHYRSLRTSPSLSRRAATSQRLILPTDRRESSTGSGAPTPRLPLRKHHLRPWLPLFEPERTPRQESSRQSLRTICGRQRRPPQCSRSCRGAGVQRVGPTGRRRISVLTVRICRPFHGDRDEHCVSAGHPPVRVHIQVAHRRRASGRRTFQEAARGEAGRFLRAGTLELT